MPGDGIERYDLYADDYAKPRRLSRLKCLAKKWLTYVWLVILFDDAFAASMSFCGEQNATFVHPFDDPKVIEGQGTVGLEIFKDTDLKIDYLLLAIGGGGLASGVSTVFKQLSPNTKIIGIEPEGAAAMKASIEKDEVVTLETVDKFVDGAAVKRVGDLTFEICRENLDRVISVPEGKVCSTILQLYNEEAIVAEPAGALTIAALDQIKDEIKGKNVVCLVSGGNNDITRTEEIKERSLLFEGLKHYFIIRFPQRAGCFERISFNPWSGRRHHSFRICEEDFSRAGSCIGGDRIKRSWRIRFAARKNE